MNKWKKHYYPSHKVKQCTLVTRCQKKKCLKTCQSRGLEGYTCALKFWAVLLIWTIKFESGLFEFHILFYPSFPLSLYKLHTLFLISKNTYLMLNYQDDTSVFEYKQNLKILYKHPPWKKGLERTQLIK